MTAEKIFYDAGGAIDDEQEQKMKESQETFFLMRKLKVKDKLVAIRGELAMREELKRVNATDVEIEAIESKILQMIENVRVDLDEMCTSHEQLKNESVKLPTKHKKKSKLKTSLDTRETDINIVNQKLREYEETCRNVIKDTSVDSSAAPKIKVAGENLEDGQVELDCSDSEERYNEIIAKQDELGNQLANKLIEMGELNKQLKQQLVVSIEKAKDLESTLMDMNASAEAATNKIERAQDFGSQKLRLFIIAIFCLVIVGVVLVLAVVVLAVFLPLLQ